jgi:hypothetical protein
MKIKEGEVFAIKTKIGYGFLQYVTTSNLGIELIRVLEPIKDSNQISQNEVNVKERYSVHFIVKAALRKKLIERTGLFTIPNEYKVPTKARTEHKVRGEFLGWHVVDQKTLQRELKKELDAEDILLSPHGHPNDTLLIEWLENDWRLENWK